LESWEEADAASGSNRDGHDGNGNGSPSPWSGMDVGVWSRHPASTMTLVDLGATSYDKAADAAGDADIVISMLPTAEATADVMIDGAALHAMRPDAIWVQMATIGVELTEWLAAEARAQRHDVDFIDAPVSGSRTPAETGQLLILASGPRRAAPALAPVFDVLGRATLWLGPAGAGSRMKLVLNTWLAFQTEGAAETAAVAERLGVPTPALFSALQGNPLASQYALAKLARMIDQDYRADFALDWALKDLDLVASAAGAGVAPVTGAIADRWRGLVGGGASGLDVSAARQGLGQVDPAPTSRPSPDLSITAGQVPSGIPQPAPTAS
jgi:3-hydroxyisobutyrate dehydrogenase